MSAPAPAAAEEAFSLEVFVKSVTSPSLVGLGPAVGVAGARSQPRTPRRAYAVQLQQAAPATRRGSRRCRCVAPHDSRTRPPAAAAVRFLDYPMLLIRPSDAAQPSADASTLPFAAGKSCLLSAVPAELNAQLDEARAARAA